ncbi:MAG TPA: IclR family transcriptional regulator [Vicinamibacterales bacterium]|nr:IclR family transcriptional regulator [Vicinamibacterales bacterium]
MPAKDQSRTVLHALDVLECLHAGQLLGVSEIAQRLGLPKTVTHRLLTTLERRQYVRKDAASRKYALTLKLWQVGSPALRADLPGLAHQVLDALVADTGETAYVSVLERLDVVWIAKVEGREPLRVYVEVGGRMPAYCTASGKALLAFAPAEVLSDLHSARLSKLTRRTITERRQLARELATIRATRVSINHGERRDDIGAVAAPVFDAMGRVIAAVGISGPLTRLQKRRLPALSAEVQRAALDLSERLGYDGALAPSSSHPMTHRSGRHAS